jgi:hypothetical protein
MDKIDESIVKDNHSHRLRSAACVAHLLDPSLGSENPEFVVPLEI